ncbi:hypothetical protein HZC21_05055 [Candidatus Peregrinibacteria bacterium]|nr:hypothetical protein [Candidatus Peregrinibacteria bacterium]
MFHKHKIQIFITGAVVFLGIIFVIVYLYSNGAFYSPPLNPTAQGIYFEKLLPPEISMAVSIQPTDEEERSRFNKLFNIIMQDKAHAALLLAVDEIIKKSGTALKPEELAVLFGKNTNFEIAYAKPNLYFLFSVENPSAVREIFKNRAEKVLIDKEKSFLAEFGGKEAFYVGLAGDVAFMTDTSQEKARKIISRAESPLRIFYKSFASTDLFRRGFAGADKPLSGYAAIKAEFGTVNLKAIKGNVAVVRAFEDGFSFTNIAIGDKSEAEGDFGRLFEPYSAHLYKKLPDGKLLIFSETHHVGATILAQLAAIESSVKSAGFKKEDFFAGLKKYTGFDFEKDLMPFLDKGFAFTVHDTGALIPAVSFFIDAGSAPDKADGVVKMLAEIVPRLAAAANAALQEINGKPVFETGKFNWGTQGGVLKINLGFIPQDKFNIPVLKYFSQPIEISYGLAADNLLFISMLPDFEKTFASADKIESSALFKETARLKISAGSISLVDGNAVLAFVERFFDIMQKEKKLSEKEKSGFEIAKAYIAPLKSFIQISQGSGEDVFGKGFLKIEK